MQTAKILAGALGVEVEVREGLEEHHRERESFIKSDEDFFLALKAFFDRPQDLVYGSETAQQALDRFSAAAQSVMDESLDDEVIVTHGTVASLYLAADFDAAYAVWQKLQMPDYAFVNWPRRS